MTRRFVERFADEMIRLDADLLWFDSARPEDIDEALARKLHADGCVMLTFGVDRGSDSVLRRMRKGFSIAAVEATLAATTAAGILSRFNLIVGFSFETAADVAATIDFVRRNAAHLDVLGCYNAFYLNEAMPLEARGVPIRRLGRCDEVAGTRTEAYDELAVVNNAILVMESLGKHRRTGWSPRRRWSRPRPTGSARC